MLVMDAINSKDQEIPETPTSDQGVLVKQFTRHFEPAQDLMADDDSPEEIDRQFNAILEEEALKKDDAAQVVLRAGFEISANENDRDKFQVFLHETATYFLLRGFGFNTNGSNSDRPFRKKGPEAFFEFSNDKKVDDLPSSEIKELNLTIAKIQESAKEILREKHNPNTDSARIQLRL